MRQLERALGMRRYRHHHLRLHLRISSTAHVHAPYVPPWYGRLPLLLPPERVKSLVSIQGSHLMPVLTQSICGPRNSPRSSTWAMSAGVTSIFLPPVCCPLWKTSTMQGWIKHTEGGFSMMGFGGTGRAEASRIRRHGTSHHQEASSSTRGENFSCRGERTGRGVPKDAHDIATIVPRIAYTHPMSPTCRPRWRPNGHVRQHPVEYHRLDKHIVN